ncbi:MAG: CRISPR-associated endonuclease Cas2 [Bacteroidales bacterium]|nr:CRISPR-associated endonuclease Cas2 [Bacteroidales bacterium]
MSLSKKDRSFRKKLLLHKHAGLENAVPPNRHKVDLDDIDNLTDRIKKILGLVETTLKFNTQMLYFIMYDIENNKIRTQISKFLERKGCIRVQKSIFLARNERKVFDEIQQILYEVNEIYDNHDSIFLIPVSTDELRGMKIIGKSLDLDIILGNKNTLFF